MENEPKAPDSHSEPRRKPSKVWYLVPIFFGILGGLVMYLVLKEEDTKMAKKGLMLGIILAAVGIACVVIFYGILFGILISHHPYQPKYPLVSIPTPIPTTPYSSQVIINNQTLEYQINGGTLKSANFNSVLPALDITIDSTTGGNITLNISRNLIDSKDRFANDVPFIVTKNGKEVLPAKEQWSNSSRVVVLNFDQKTSVFEIIGTGVGHIIIPSMHSVIKITNPDPHTKDLFGSSIATLNGTIIIGTPNAISTNNTRGGVVYLFDDTGKRILTIPDPDDNNGDQFGFSVAVLGSKIVVGAPSAFSHGIQCGKVYLFDLEGRLLQTFTDPDPHQQDLFGYSLATSQDNIVIGSPSHVNDKVQSGSVYVFDSSGNKLFGITNPDKENGDMFGFSLVQIGNQIAVGAPNSNHDALQAGSAFVFDIKSGSLTLTIRNPSPDNRTEPNSGSDQFGFSLANANGFLVIGERGGDIKQIVNGEEQYQTDQSGNVRIYDLTNDKMIQTIDDPHPVQNNNFGVSVSAYGDKILIGMNHDDTSGYDAGSAFVYDIQGSMIQEIQNPTPTPVTFEKMGNYFGSSVLFVKNVLVISSPGDNTGAINAGAVYLIRNSTAPITQIKYPSSTYFPGVVKFYNTADGGAAEDNRVFKQLPSTLSTDSWVVDFDYKFTASSIPAAYPLSITSTSANPEQQGPNRDAILVYHGDNSDVLHLRVWNGFTVIDSPSLYTGIPINPDIQYYIRLQRTPTQLELNVFSDPARTIQILGSPINLTIAPTDFNNLNFIQHSASLSSGMARTLTAEVDNMKISIIDSFGNKKTFFADDYSSNVGWTQIGSSIAVNGSFVTQNLGGSVVPLSHGYLFTEKNKFDKGFYEKILGMIDSGETRRYGIVMFVDNANKDNLVDLLLHVHNATNVYKAQRLSVVTAYVPVREIPKLADYNFVLRIGDGESEAMSTLETQN